MVASLGGRLHGAAVRLVLFSCEWNVTVVAQLRVAVLGAAGRRGRMGVEAVQDAPDMIFAGGVGRGDDVRRAIDTLKPTVLVDFTTPEAVVHNMYAGIEAAVPLVVGTSGLTADDLAPVDEAARKTGVG